MNLVPDCRGCRGCGGCVAWDRRGRRGKAPNHQKDGLSGNRILNYTDA